MQGITSSPLCKLSRLPFFLITSHTQLIREWFLKTFTKFCVFCLFSLGLDFPAAHNFRLYTLPVTSWKEAVDNSYGNQFGLLEFVIFRFRLQDLSQPIVGDQYWVGFLRRHKMEFGTGKFNLHSYDSINSHFLTPACVLHGIGSKSPSKYRSLLSWFSSFQKYLQELQLTVLPGKSTRQEN